ncbi:uncharacterized protein LOC110181727 [Drosophila serrata]|uniref:uncharacterized protein LOC110181727 n=1 Tax=Drosophila serrata TaxID=7274 RepID=UPI000A1D2644|nr:uncharacterized protein LOC110181727 [Drosophila serrata]
MKYPILMAIIVCFLSGGATLGPKRKGNESLVETTAVSNFTEFLKVPFHKEDDDMYTLMSLSLNQKMREVLTFMHWAYKYTVAKVRRGINRFENNMEILRELHRRHQKDALNVGMRAKQRRIRNIRPMAPFKLARQVRPFPVRLLTEPDILSQLAANINNTTGEDFMVSIVAAI